MQPNFLFLCEKHRALAIANPDRCQRLCEKLRLSGQQELKQQRFNQAIPIYGTAFEAAQLLLSQNNHSKRQLITEHYLRIAVEFVYACRKSQHHIDLPHLVEIIKAPLATLLSPTSSQTALAPVIDIAYAPIAQADHWINSLLALDESRQHTLH